MTDQFEGAFGAAQEQGQTSEVLPQAEHAAPESPQLVTVDLLERALEQVADRLERRLQSLTDKQENRLKKEVERRLSALAETYQELGIPVPEGAKQRVIEDVALSYLDDGGERAHAKPPFPELVEFVNRQAAKIAKNAGVTLEPSDPEFAMVKVNTLDPDEYLESWKAAVDAKVGRVKSVQPTTAAQNVTNPQAQTAAPVARVPAAGAGTPGGQDLMAKYRQEAAKLRPASEELLQLRRKYRALGLDL